MSNSPFFSRKLVSTHCRDYYFWAVKMNSGWIKLHRKIVEWEWFQDSDTFRLFLYLILKANHREKQWKGITISRGQLVTGRKMLSRELGISEQTVRTCLKRLKSTS